MVSISLRVMASSPSRIANCAAARTKVGEASDHAAGAAVQVAGVAGQGAGLVTVQQWEQLRRCLHDNTVPLDVRVAGSLLLLFGIRASHLVRIQADHIEHTSGATHLRVAEHALLLPPLVATLALTQRDRDDLRSVFGRASASHTRWLFPGIRPGLAMDAHSLAFKLNDHGINVRAARNTALGELAADLPPPVLAELVGIGITTATRWARYASRDWRPYLAARCGISSILSVRTSLT